MKRQTSNVKRKCRLLHFLFRLKFARNRTRCLRTFRIYRNTANGQGMNCASSRATIHHSASGKNIVRTQMRARAFHADLLVTEFSAPTVFAFSGSDETGTFSHRFTFEKIENRTRVTRTVNFDLSLGQYIFYLMMLNRVRLPVAKKALEKLKERLEKQ